MPHKSDKLDQIFYLMEILTIRKNEEWSWVRQGQYIKWFEFYIKVDMCNSILKSLNVDLYGKSTFSALFPVFYFNKPILTLVKRLQRPVKMSRDLLPC